MVRRVIGLIVFLAVPLSAQQFSGTVEAKFAKDALPAQLFNWAVTGEQWSMELRDEKDEAVAFRMLFNRSSRQLREAVYAKGKLSEATPASLPPISVGVSQPPTLRPLDKKQKVSGQACSNYAFELDGRALEGCFTAELGRFVAPNVQRPVSIGKGKDVWSPSLPKWALALSESELFPLKVWDEKGKTLMEVTAVVPGKFPFCSGAIPEALLAEGKYHTPGEVIVIKNSYSANTAPTRISDLIGLGPAPACPR